MRIAGYFLLIFVFLFSYFSCDAQPGTTIDLKKPKLYENRTLASEKTTTSKIKKGKKFYQNTITHFNYYFNANQRLNDIIDRAQLGFKDNFTQLLPYYNYSLDITASDPDIDSVIYKCNAGILLHDLRTDWVDDLYFLMGRAYYLRKNYDSAEHVFLYVNYAFGPKEDGYDVPIGSNANGTEFTIATKEKSGISLSKPPRRNEDLIWVAKNFIDEGKPYEASSILEMLRNDPNFPARLQPELHETMGYLFYKSGLYDSAAYHLSKATDLDDSKLDKARREYLAGQLYMSSGDKENAEKYFARSAEHTVDPYMAVYASLNEINASPDTADVTEKKIASLTRLAKKDRYVDFRDLIYYTIAQLEFENGDYAKAYAHTKQSIKYNVTNTKQRSLSFMLLGDLDYDKPDYLSSKNYYDSVEAGSLSDTDQLRLTTRLSALQVIASNIKTIDTEDSLQTVARLPESQRVAFIKKTVRQLRKAQGLKDDDNSAFVNPAVQSSNITGTPTNTDLFAAQQAAAKGDWYFNNASLKSSGFNSFKTTWGNRPDVDNWRRVDAVNKQITQQSKGNPDASDSDDNSLAVDHPFNNNLINGGQPMQDQPSIRDKAMNGEITYDALLAYLPLSDDAMKESNGKIAEAYFNNGVQFQNQLEDYNAAITSYDSLIKRFPSDEHVEEATFNIYYCYTKLGRKSSADSALAVLNTKFKDGSFAKLAARSKVTSPKGEDSATREYEKVYGLFIEGKFEEAKAAKASADSMYGNSYWTPQLLYIESIYFISKRDDSTAITTLTSLTQKFASSPLSKKAQTMIDVLKRRSQIETYLTNLQVTRLPDDEPSQVVDLNPSQNITRPKEIKNDTIVSKSLAKVVKPNVDTIKAIAGNEKTFVFNPSDKQFVGILLNKVDPVYANETRNAFNRYNQANLYNQKIDVASQKLNDSLNVVLLGPFSDAATALIYVDKVKPKAAGIIIPWLKPEKYSFTIISQYNLDILNNTKDVSGYKSLLDKMLPGKF